MTSEPWVKGHAVFISASFVIFFIAFIFVRHVFPEGIIFYQGTCLGVIIAILEYALARYLNRNPLGILLKDLLLTVLLIYAFVLTVPTTVDRSYTVRLLRYLSDSPNGVSREQITQFYVLDFVNHGAIEKRLSEQEATGTIAQHGGMYSLTRSGIALDWAFRLTCSAFVCQQSSPQSSASGSPQVR